MKNYIDRIYRSWENLKVPTENQLYQKKSVPDTNLFLIKDSEGRFGLMAHDVRRIDERLSDIEILFHNSINDLQGTQFRNCVVLITKKTSDSWKLAESIQILQNELPKNKYSSDDIIFALERVNALLQAPLTVKSEVIGLWGELYFLKWLLTHTSKDQHRFILSSWEGNETRSIIDFVFQGRDFGIEVKTTYDENRIHFIHGLEQIIIPDRLGISEGILASLLIYENKYGANVNDLRKSIVSYLKDVQLTDLFGSRIKIRGINLAHNEDFRFDLTTVNLAFYSFSNVPVPLCADNIVDVSWSVKFKQISALEKRETEERILSRL